MKSIKIISFTLCITLLFNIFGITATATTNSEQNKINNASRKTLNINEYKIEKIPQKFNKYIDKKTAICLDDSDAEDMNSFTVINDDGTKTLRVFNDPIKYIDEETQKVQFIDNSLVVSSNEDNAYECVTNSIKTYFPKEISKGFDLIKGENKVKITPVVCKENKNNKSKYSKTNINKKDYLQYENVFGENTSLQIAPTNTGVKENVVLEKYNGVNTFNYIIDAGKLFPRESQGKTITFVDPKTDDEVFEIKETFVYDSKYNSNNNSNEDSITYDNYYTIEKQNNGKYLLTTVVDETFLKAETTVYPVVIDPQIAWESETDNIVCDSIPMDDDFQDFDNRFTIGKRYGTDWRMWLRIKNFKRFRHINPKLVIKADIDIWPSIYPGPMQIYLGTSTANKSISSSPDSSECFSSTLETVARGTITDEILNYIQIKDIFVKWLEIDRKAVEDYTFVPGFVMYTDSYFYDFLEIDQDYLPCVSVNYIEDENIKDDVYYIKNSKHYLCADSEGEIFFTKDTSTAQQNGLWKVTKDSSNYSYRIQSCTGPSNYSDLYLDFTLVDKITLESRVLDDCTQEWRIVNNYDGTHRIINYYENAELNGVSIKTATVNAAYSKLSAQNCSFSEYQSWEFVPYSNSKVYQSNIKTTSQWPASKAKSTKNLLYGKTPYSMEHKTNSTYVALGNGTTSAYIMQEQTNGAEMTDGDISGYNVDLRGYGLNEYENDYGIKFVNHSDGSYRKKGELYVDITYSLGSEKTFNSLWFATNINKNYFTVGSFEVYTSNKLNELYFTKNKIAEFDHSQSTWSGVVNIDFRGDYKGKYFGIRITQGLIRQNDAWGLNNSNFANSYARVRDIVLLKESRKKVTYTNYYDEGMLARWNTTDEQIKGIIGISAMQTYAKSFLESLEYNGENMGLQISFNNISKHTSSADLCQTDGGINGKCKCESNNHKKETTILKKFANETEYEILELKVPILWTGHLAINNDGEQVLDGGATYYKYGRHIILLNTGAGVSTELKFSSFLTSKRIQTTYLHELCHTLGANDSYCFGTSENGKCENERCATCCPEVGYKSSCIMANGDTSEGDYNDLLCAKCKQDIYNYLMGEQK